MGRGILQGIRDSTALVVCVKFTDDSLQIDELLTVNPDSSTDMILKANPVSEMAIMKSVPERQMVYWGLHGDSKPLMAYAKRVIAEMPFDQLMREKFAQSMGIMRDVKFGTIAGGGNLTLNDNGAMTLFGITEVGPIAKIREAFAVLGGNTEYEIAGIRQRQSYSNDAEQIDGLSVDVFTFEQTVPPELDPLGMQKALNEKLYGPNGLTQRIVTKDNVMYQATGGGTAAMQQLLKSEPWSDAHLLSARGRLPDKANLIILVDMPSSFLAFAKLMVSTGVLPIPLQENQLDGLELPASYAGFSLMAEPQRLSGRSSLPIESFQAFVKIGMHIQQLRAEQAGSRPACV